MSGKELKVHRNLPNDDLQAAMSAYVDSMDLSTFGKDDEGEEAEYAPMDETFSPMLHRINQVIKHRAIYTEADVPETYEILLKYSHPPVELVQQSRPALDKVMKAGVLRKVLAKAQGKRFGRKGREEEKPLSELDVGALLAQDPRRKTKRIDPKNAIPEFRQMVDSSRAGTDLTDMNEGVKQMKKIIFDWITNSVGDMNYMKVVEGTREMWWHVRRQKLGPILKTEVGSSEFTAEQADQFMKSK